MKYRPAIEIYSKFRNSDSNLFSVYLVNFKHAGVGCLNARDGEVLAVLLSESVYQLRIGADILIGR